MRFPGIAAESLRLERKPVGQELLVRRTVLVTHRFDPILAGRDISFSLRQVTVDVLLGDASGVPTAEVSIGAKDITQG